MTKSLYKISFYIALIMSTVGFFSQIEQGPVSFEHTDKIAHFVIFFVLTGLLVKGFMCNNKTALIAAAGYGAFVEVIQGSLTARQASFWDWVADVVGAIAVLYVLSLISKYTQKQIAQADKEAP